MDKIDGQTDEAKGWHFSCKLLDYADSLGMTIWFADEEIRWAGPDTPAVHELTPHIVEHAEQLMEHRCLRCGYLSLYDKGGVSVCGNCCEITYRVCGNCHACNRWWLWFGSWLCSRCGEPSVGRNDNENNEQGNEDE